MHIPRAVQLAAVTFFACASIHSQQVSTDTAAQGRSVADAAREYREKQRDTVRIGPSESKELFSTMDKVLGFVSSDTGYAQHGTVNRRLLGRKELDAQFVKGVDDSKVDEALQQSEVVLQKFGLLPAEYSLKSYLTNVYPKQIGGFYNPKDKTMYLLNWIPLESQKKILPHELTHALQDQNYDLARYGVGKKENKKNEKDKAASAMMLSGTDEGERSTVQRAFIEGQAMVVFYDYILNQSQAPTSLRPELLKNLKNDLQEYEQVFSVRNAPLVLEATAMFPYREGLAFELELLNAGGKKAAFPGTFARPPKTTHEILQPAAYIANKPGPTFALPDLRPVLGASYEAFDAGWVGEFDVNIMVRQYGRDGDVNPIVPFWNGGGYVAAKRVGAKKEPATSDLGLIYVSNWKSEQAAIYFAKLYKGALSKRVQVKSENVAESADCGEQKNCFAPLWAARVSTNEGPVFLEVWPGNRLIISESFDDKTFSSLRRLILTAQPAKATASLNRELSMRLYQSPTFASFQQQLGSEIMEKLLQKTAQ